MASPKPEPAPDPREGPLPIPRKRGRPKRRKATATDLIGVKHVRHLQKYLDSLHAAYDHPNRALHYDTFLVAHQLAFFNPTLRSTRTIEDFSQLPEVQKVLGVQCICRNTFSQASKLFDPALLAPLVRDLRQRIPDLRYGDPQLHSILQKIVAADGSFFTIAADVAWALHHTKSNGQTQGRVRLDFQLDVLRWVPQQIAVSGQAQGSETATQRKMLETGVIYLTDRNYVDFEYLKAVLAAGSDFVLRTRSNAPNFRVERELPLETLDREHGVISDRLGHLPGSGGDTPPPPPQMLRELVIADPATGQAIRILTSLLELPAHIIGLLYRHRWQIELFFRWLKVFACFRHLISHSANGLSIQFYVAVIGTLLMYAHSGRRPSKYAFSLLSCVAGGQASLEEILPILERREREREVARARLARKKAEKRKV
jgi:hypothetical protein